MMDKQVRRRPIPWEFNSSNGLTIWEWKTPHFLCSIVSEKRGPKEFIHWKIIDKTRDKESKLDDNVAKTFKEAVDEIAETVAKAYPEEFGYSVYAGALATQYRLKNKITYNFGPLIGEKVTLVSETPDGKTQEYTGFFDVKNYNLAVRENQSITKVPPNYVTDILGESRESILPLLKESESVRNPNSTIFYHPKQKGCTGQSGPYGDKVIHGPYDSYCPIHNI